MTLLSPDVVLTQLRWRYATKKFDATKKIPADLWGKLEDALVLSPSSYGLQPWKFFIVDNPAIREQLLPHSWGQKQIVDASHLVVFALKKGVGAVDAQRLTVRTAEVRGVSPAALNGYMKMMIGSLTSKPREQVDVWMGNQVFIALGQFMTTAAMLGIDTCPMEGFVPEKYDEILGLPAKGYHALVVATAGYRAANDAYAGFAKVRFPRDEMVEHV